MSKTLVTHGRPFPIDRPKCGLAHCRCQCRSRSVGRPEALGYHHDYFTPEFTRDGNPAQSPKLTSIRDRYLHPGMHKTHNHVCTRKVQGSDRIEIAPNAMHIETVRPKHHQHHVHRERHFSLPLPRRSERGLDERLKRKSVFALKQEVKTSPSTTQLQEISDMNLITSMCMATMKSMMESKRHRRFLYHMNNNAHYPQLECLHATLMDNMLDGSNNSDMAKRKQMAERVFGVNTAKPANLEEIKDRSKDMEMKQKATARYRLDRLEQDLDRQDMAITTTDRISFQQQKGESSKSPAKSRRDSVRMMETKMPITAAPSMSRARAYSKAVPRFKQFGPSDHIDRLESDADLALIMDNPHLSQREVALKLLAEIQAKFEKRKHTIDEDERPGPVRVVRAITPQEALQCAWLRLSRSQVATLEELIRQQGIDPGLHAHSDVSEYDVFAEVREIRRKEIILKEEAENRSDTS